MPMRLEKGTGKRWVQILTLSLGLAAWTLPAGAQTVERVTLQYRITDEESGAVLDTAVVAMVPGESGSWAVEWRSRAAPQNTEDVQLDSTFATTSWRVRFAQDGYEYTGRRIGDVLRIEGTLNGEEISEDLEIDERPFYYNWQLGLIDFVRSGEEKRRFWTFRPDNQGVYSFEAQRKEEAVVTIDGREERVTRVEWGLSGWRRTFYKGNQWYRTTDGYMVTESRDDRLMELVGTSVGPGR